MQLKQKEKKRCNWVGIDPLYIEYHDREWGVPVHVDNIIFEFLMLEGMQAGLSWLTILRKRTNFRDAFDNFEPLKISRYGEKEIKRLLNNEGIIRNKLKILAVIQNAKAFLKFQKEFGSFDAYIWQFTRGKPIINSWESIKEIPAHTAESDSMSKDLKKRGFKFVGSTICYAHMQATGMVNDHVIDCFRYKEIVEGVKARHWTLRK
ncbi:MAG: DNA-3-methyladenine glycosylase [Candidatus Fischerbacteria bacterium RBG_13_37_8]|uniref:DNA-3-methyladenine glycosylase I n=1 Tax=Candidatus Fischerbacteria bacterium RBG_13_37_8 TaxID=1817863 RepID=A0A1F5VHS4_9BACT|nr:MAG: DNA-3-methyladenine glycosylase [Candidatus Fischerbacteria bacterium RBG_13_37_8]